jgi:hypothetical protein
MIPFMIFPGNLFSTLTAILHIDWTPSPSVTTVDGRTLNTNFPKFYIFLTVHLRVILESDQLDEQFRL